MSSTPFRFIQRRTTVSGRRPTTDTLYTGELYLQLADEAAHFYNADYSRLVTIVTDKNITGYTSGIVNNISGLSGLVNQLSGLINSGSGNSGVVADVQVLNLTDDRLLQSGDANNILKINSDTSFRIFVPEDSNTFFKNGSKIEIAQINVGQALIEQQNSLVTIYSNQDKFATDGIGSISTLTKIESNKWILNGDISSSITAPSKTPKYFSGVSDGDWFNTGNWFADAALTIHSTGLPIGLSNIVFKGSKLPSVSLDNPNWIQPNLIDTTGVTNITGILLYATGSGKLFSGNISGNCAFSGVDIV